jgi:hypothetical protein
MTAVVSSPLEPDTADEAGEGSEELVAEKELAYGASVEMDAGTVARVEAELL